MLMCLCIWKSGHFSTHLLERNFSAHISAAAHLGVFPINVKSKNPGEPRENAVKSGPSIPLQDPRAEDALRLDQKVTQTEVESYLQMSVHHSVPLLLHSVTDCQLKLPVTSTAAVTKMAPCNHEEWQCTVA
jgi:hypothetical protein